MATNAKALKALYEALGGEEELVNPSNLECLNAIAVLGGGEAQETNAAAIAEIAENPPSGGGGSITTFSLGISNASGQEVAVQVAQINNDGAYASTFYKGAGDTTVQVKANNGVAYVSFWGDDDEAVTVTVTEGNITVISTDAMVAKNLFGYTAVKVEGTGRITIS